MRATRRSQHRAATSSCSWTMTNCSRRASSSVLTRGGHSSVTMSSGSSASVRTSYEESGPGLVRGGSISSTDRLTMIRSSPGSGAHRRSRAQAGCLHASVVLVRSRNGGGSEERTPHSSPARSRPARRRSGPPRIYVMERVPADRSRFGYVIRDRFRKGMTHALVGHGDRRTTGPDALCRQIGRAPSSSPSAYLLVGLVRGRSAVARALLMLARQCGKLYAMAGGRWTDDGA